MLPDQYPGWNRTSPSGAGRAGRAGRASQALGDVVCARRHGDADAAGVTPHTEGGREWASASRRAIIHTNASKSEPASYFVVSVGHRSRLKSFPASVISIAPLERVGQAAFDTGFRICETQRCCRFSGLRWNCVLCRSGGIGRRAWFRSTVLARVCGGSSFFGTKRDMRPCASNWLRRASSPFMAFLRHPFFNAWPLPADALRMAAWALLLRDPRPADSLPGGGGGARISLQLDRGRGAGLVGESGSGKSVNGAGIMGLLGPERTDCGADSVAEGRRLRWRIPVRRRALRETQNSRYPN